VKKTHQRLDYNRLAEALGERGLVEPDALRMVLSQSLTGSGLFPELLVSESHISDWDLSRVVCEVFGLPFLTPEYYAPAPEAAAGIDRALLHEQALVPVDRFGSVLTVMMPGLTPTQVLGDLGDHLGVRILPVVSAVESNRRYLREHLPLPDALKALMADDPDEHGLDDAELEEIAAAVGRQGEEGSGDDWASLFDVGDAAVLLELEGDGDKDVDEIDSIPPIPEVAPEGISQDAEDSSDSGLPELPHLPDLGATGS